MQLSELKENSFIYVGPSWAATSFGHEEPTNLLEQWELSAVNYSQRGKRNLDFIRIPDYNIDRPCVWVFCEPLVELFKGVRNPQEGDRDYPGIASYLDAVDHRLHHSKLKRQQLEQMNNLGVPIGLIGSHCDVYESDIQGLENLSIIHPSWQQWMKDQCQLTDFTLNFGCDIANNMIQEIGFNNVPNKVLVDDIWNQYVTWNELQVQGLFHKTHPNRKSNIEFAKETRDAVVDFLKAVA